MPPIVVIPIVAGIGGYLMGATSDTKKFLLFGAVGVGAYIAYKATKK